MLLRSVRNGKAFYPGLSWLPTSAEVSAMDMRCPEHAGYDTSLFSCISALQGCLPLAIEKGVPDPSCRRRAGSFQAQLS